MRENFVTKFGEAKFRLLNKMFTSRVRPPTAQGSREQKKPQQAQQPELEDYIEKRDFLGAQTLLEVFTCRVLLNLSGKKDQEVIIRTR